MDKGIAIAAIWIAVGMIGLKDSDAGVWASMYAMVTTFFVCLSY